MKLPQGTHVDTFQFVSRRFMDLLYAPSCFQLLDVKCLESFRLRCKEDQQMGMIRAPGLSHINGQISHQRTGTPTDFNDLTSMGQISPHPTGTHSRKQSQI